VPEGTLCEEVCTTMDLLPTFARLADTAPPDDRVIDGKDIWELLSENAASPHEAFYYYQVDQLQAVRSGPWKLHLPLKDSRTHGHRGQGGRELALYDVAADVGETTDVSAQHPEVVEKLMELAELSRVALGDDDREGIEVRPAGWVEDPAPRLSED